MKNIKVFKSSIEFGGYMLPAEFVYLDKDFLHSLIDLDFLSTINIVYEKLTKREFKSEFLSEFYNDEYYNLFNFDDSLALLDLTLGNTLNYTDYIFDTSDLFGKVCSLISIFTAVYIDVVSSNVIEFYEKINFSVPLDDGILLLALIIARRVGLPINYLTVGSKINFNCNISKLFISSLEEDDILDITNFYFEEYSLPLDPITAMGICSFEDFFSNVDDDSFNVVLNVTSPYLFSRKIVKTLFNKSELSVEKAIKMINEESSLEIPKQIQNGEIVPFYKNCEVLPLECLKAFLKEFI